MAVPLKIKQPLKRKHDSCEDGENSSVEVQDNKDEAKQAASYSSSAQRMMMNMGYIKGKGLGAHGQGITEPIQASNQRGRRGIGHIIKGFEPATDLKWDSSQEYISVKEDVIWLPENSSDPPDYETLYSWLGEGPYKNTIEDEYQFCDPDVLKGVLSAKTTFDDLEDRELQNARKRSNPFETIGKCFFQNRAAMKMANMDGLLDFMFTSPLDENGDSLIKPGEILYFADVCAAPGGFSEYVLWRRKMTSKGFCDAKGFGFTLKHNDFKLHDFLAAPPECFEKHYGKGGSDGDGDVYKPENITCFKEFVLKSTNDLGVHFMMADGGFSVEGQENMQEVLSKQLYLCQFLVALGVLRKGGHFVCKLFDIFTPFSVGLVYLMNCCFRKTALIKPNTSRPANSERFIVCKWKKDNVESVYTFLFDINDKIQALHSRGLDVVEVVPVDILKNDRKFFDYIVESNNVFGTRQIVGLNKIRCFCQDTTLIEERQLELKQACLKAWDVPDTTRIARSRVSVTLKIRELLSPDSLDSLHTSPVDLMKHSLEHLRSPHDYRFFILASPRSNKTSFRGFFVGMGGTNVEWWDGKPSSSWSRINKFELPADTLIYGELVTEFPGDGKGQRKINTFHIIDGIVLNGFNIRHLHLMERLEYLRKFAIALNKPSLPHLCQIRIKEAYRLLDMSRILTWPNLQVQYTKGSQAPQRVFRSGNFCVIPSAILLLKTTSDPWMISVSRKHKQKYFYNVQTQESVFHTPADSIASFCHSYNNGFIWYWNEGVRVLPEDLELPDQLHLEDIMFHLQKPL